MPAAPAVVLLSGGLDSATTLAIARSEGFAPYAMSFRYGQRHALELASAAAVSRAQGAVEHRVVDIDLRSFGASALTADIAGPQGPERRRARHGHPRHLRARPEHHLPLVRPRLGGGTGRRGYLPRRQRRGLQRLSRLSPGIHRGRSNGWQTWPPARPSRAGASASTPRSSRWASAPSSPGGSSWEWTTPSRSAATTPTRTAPPADGATPASSGSRASANSARLDPARYQSR